jgi:hypothetical protein
MPGVTPGLEAHVDALWLRSGWFSPRLRVAALVARSGAVRASYGTADFEWVAARVGLCPVRFGSERSATLRPCAIVDAGRLRGEGSDIEPHGEASVFWAATGFELSGGLRLVGPLHLGGEVGILLPFRRDRFYFKPDDDIHEVPAAGVSAGAGLDLVFF